MLILIKIVILALLFGLTSCVPPEMDADLALCITRYRQSHDGRHPTALEIQNHCKE